MLLEKSEVLLGGLKTFPEPHTTSQQRETMMDNQGGDRESAAGSSVSARGEEPSSGELPPELTCPPEDYRTAKFSLAAYLLCWALLRWYQVRIFGHLHLICVAVKLVKLSREGGVNKLGPYPGEKYIIGCQSPN